LTRTDLERFPEVDFLRFLQAQWNHRHDRLGAENERARTTHYTHSERRADERGGALVVTIK
jgi:hypothetical protein